MKYVYKCTFDYSHRGDPRDRGSIGGATGVITADSDEEAVEKVRNKHGGPPEVTIDWIYAIHHQVAVQK